MTPDWTILIAVILILLKQLFKLYLRHKPDRLDYLKAVASLPVDISFLIVALLVKEASLNSTSSARLLCFVLAYIVVSIFVTILWRVCDSSVTASFGKHFIWAFPLNAAISVTTFYFAIQLLG